MAVKLWTAAIKNWNLSAYITAKVDSDLIS
jgi:hypothetical protein